jgi:hypothetical protein
LLLCRVVINAQAMEPEANLVEKYYGVKYGYEKLSKEQLNVCCIGYSHLWSLFSPAIGLL